MQSISEYAKSKKYKFFNIYAKYIELYINNTPVELKYNPEIQDFDKVNSFELEYMSNYFGYNSQKNFVFVKFHEDMFNELKLPMPNNSKYMDGYGLITHSKPNTKFSQIRMEFVNILNYVDLINLKK
jgi:hypothetical protein